MTQDEFERLTSQQKLAIAIEFFRILGAKPVQFVPAESAPQMEASGRL